jgi:hypothetical protein
MVTDNTRLLDQVTNIKLVLVGEFFYGFPYRLFGANSLGRSTMVVVMTGI